MTATRALAYLILVSTGLRLAWAASVGLGHDEAYHYLFSVHRDWSYFDHPPMLALVESLGPLILGSASPLALRLGFVLLFAGSTWLLARLTSRSFGPWAGFCAAFALNVSAYHSAAAGAFALPDGPLLFFWLLTLDRLAVAIEDPRRITPWLIAGMAWGGALLSKYHAIFLPMGLLVYLVLTPSARWILKAPGPYLATLLGLAMFAPVVWWNATHHWASFAFQGGRAVATLGFKPLSLLAAIGGQAAYLLPWIWVMLLIALVHAIRRLIQGEATAAERFLISQSITPLALFTAIASVKPVLPHWTLVGYISAYPLLGRLWAERLAVKPARMKRIFATLAVVPPAIAALIVAQYDFGIIPVDRLLPGKITTAQADPTAEFFGWDQVADQIKHRGLLSQPGTFLFTGIWYNSGHLGYATRDLDVPVVCYNPGDARSFAFWSQPVDWVGRDGVLVSSKESPVEPACYAPWFEKIEPAGEVDIVRAGKVVRTLCLFRCEKQIAPFPFEYGNVPRRRPPPRLAGSSPKSLSPPLSTTVR
jgi:4-amino-4-deoxy-L-arabinose transferase-like glycosyltransferase